jgi:hypothetical protein
MDLFTLVKAKLSRKENGPASVFGQMLSLGLRLSRCDHLARRRQGQHFFLHELCRRYHSPLHLAVYLFATGARSGAP